MVSECKSSCINQAALVFMHMYEFEWCSFTAVPSSEGHLFITGPINGDKPVFSPISLSRVRRERSHWGNFSALVMHDSRSCRQDFIDLGNTLDVTDPQDGFTTCVTLATVDTNRLLCTVVMTCYFYSSTAWEQRMKCLTVGQAGSEFEQQQVQ